MTINKSLKGMLVPSTGSVLSGKICTATAVSGNADPSICNMTGSQAIPTASLMLTLSVVKEITRKTELARSSSYITSMAGTSPGFFLLVSKY